jgi:protein-tyrosine-phosphatase
MAEAFARAIGRERVDAHSAGSRPSGEVDPRAVAFMSEVGIGLIGQRSKGLADIPPGVWDYLVTMGCGDACPNVPAFHRLDWDLPDPKTLDDGGFRGVRDQIARRVAALLADASQP